MALGKMALSTALASMDRAILPKAMSTLVPRCDLLGVQRRIASQECALGITSQVSPIYNAFWVFDASQLESSIPPIGPLPVLTA